MDLTAAFGQRQVQLLTFACVRGSIDTVALPQVVGIPQPSNVVLRISGPDIFVVGLPPQAIESLRGRTVTVCGIIARVFGTGPFAQQSVLAVIPFFFL